MEHFLEALSLYATIGKADLKDHMNLNIRWSSLRIPERKKADEDMQFSTKTKSGNVEVVIHVTW